MSSMNTPWEGIRARTSTVIATLFGIGSLLPIGQGTVAALAAVCLVPLFLHLSIWWQASLIILLGIVGVWSSHYAERAFGTKDDHRIVIDEFVSVFIQFFAFRPDQIGWMALGSGLALNRALDIAKPFGIHRLQKITGGWGVMIDDIAVGILAQLAMRAFFFLLT
jgi:phosphatidylglycerophosphatase A